LISNGLYACAFLHALLNRLQRKIAVQSQTPPLLENAISIGSDGPIWRKFDDGHFNIYSLNSEASLTKAWIGMCKLEVNVRVQ